jgi:hypothetical protein
MRNRLSPGVHSTRVTAALTPNATSIPCMSAQIEAEVTV